MYKIMVRQFFIHMYLSFLFPFAIFFHTRPAFEVDRGFSDLCDKVTMDSKDNVDPEQWGKEPYEAGGNSNARQCDAIFSLEPCKFSYTLGGALGRLRDGGNSTVAT